jgi:hypothetical protein
MFARGLRGSCRKQRRCQNQNRAEIPNLRDHFASSLNGVPALTNER